MRLDYRRTFFIGFGFFSVSVAWAIYNTYVPILLNKYLATTLLIGMVMTIDNVFGVVLQPLFGALSDRTWTKIGRRMPYIAIGIPVCAALFLLVPATRSLWWLMAVLIAFNLVMSLWRAPCVALMPDITPPKLRSQANGIINLCGGVGTLLALGVGGYFYKMGEGIPFYIAALVMGAAMLCMLLFVREERHPAYLDAEQGGREEGRTDGRSRKKSLLFLLAAIFLWFCGYNAIETFFSLYVTHTLMLDAGDASFMLAGMSLAFLAMAIPAGLIAGRLGRKASILVGLGAMCALVPVAALIKNVWVISAIMIVAGAGWAFVNINSLPMVVQMAAHQDIGKYTGYYYFFSFSAAIVSPILCGWIRDYTQSYTTIFWYAMTAFMLAFILMLPVRHGEAEAREKVSVADVLAQINE